MTIRSLFFLLSFSFSLIAHYDELYDFDFEQEGFYDQGLQVTELEEKTIDLPSFRKKCTSCIKLSILALLIYDCFEINNKGRGLPIAFHPVSGILRFSSRLFLVIGKILRTAGL